MPYMRFICYLFVFSFSFEAIADDRVGFFRSVVNDHGRGVARMLEKGMDPNTADEHGQTALVAALKEESDEVVEVLLRHPRIQVDLANRAGETPLMMAALRANLVWMERLLSLGAQVNRDGWTPLHYAASSTEVKPVALLLERGARVDAVSPTGFTPLMMAARHGAIDAARLLLSRGADAAYRAPQGGDAAGFARSAGRDRLAEEIERAARRR
jgi:ankyrin repeat protein